MLNLRTQIQGDRQLRLLGDALTGAIDLRSLDDATVSALFDAAQKNGVLGLFPLPHPAFAASVAAARARNLRATRFTRRVVDAIEGAGIRVVVLKGVAAGSRWPDPTLRQQSDVDVLVEKRDKDAAAAALISARVCSQRFIVSDQLHNDSLEPADPSGLLVEVHHYFNNHHETRVDVGELLARRVHVATPQGSVPALAPEDDAVYLALHATTHALQRLAWILDLSVLTVDWNEAARRAADWGAAAAVTPAWRRARELLRLAIPQTAFERLGVPRWQQQLSAITLAAADGSTESAHQFFERLFRLVVIPPARLPGVLVQKMRGRGEESRGYASRRAITSSSDSLVRPEQPQQLRSPGNGGSA